MVSQKHEASHNNVRRIPNILPQTDLLTTFAEVRNPTQQNRPFGKQAGSTLSLRTRATLFAIGLSLLPVTALGVAQFLHTDQPVQTTNSRSNSEAPTPSAAPSLLTYLLVGGATILVVSLLTNWLVKRTIQPVLQASGVLRKLGQGQFNSRLNIDGNDEVAILSTNIDWLANQLQSWQQQKTAEVEHAHLLKELVLHLSQTAQLDDSLNTAVHAIRQALNADRVMIYRLAEPISPIIEAVDPEYPRVVSQKKQTLDAWFTKQEIEQLQQGQTRSIYQIEAVDQTEIQLSQLRAFAVRASLAIPIIADQQLVGVLMVHQCSGSRVWQLPEVELCYQLVNQLKLAWERNMLVERTTAAQKAAQEALRHASQKNDEGYKAQLSALLDAIEAAVQGDLSVRATVSEGEVGRVAERYNALMDTLHQFVTQVNQAIAQVEVLATEETQATQQLAATTSERIGMITIKTLDALEQLTQTAQASPIDADQIAATARIALTTADSGETALNRTIQSFSMLQETVPEIAKTLKDLQEPVRLLTQHIAQMDETALQTSILAMSASFDANQAGESSETFEEFAIQARGLVDQLVTTAQGIEQVLDQIQHNTHALMGTISQGDGQAVKGALWVEAIHENLNHMRQLYHDLNEWKQEVLQASPAQSDVDQDVVNLMQELTAIADSCSETTNQLSQSLQRTVQVTQHLQSSVQSFKVGTVAYEPIIVEQTLN